MSDDIQFGDMRTAYGKSLVELGEQDKNVVVLGADSTDSLTVCYTHLTLPTIYSV